MNFNIFHKIEYSYSKPVFLEPLLLKLHPRGDYQQHVKHFTYSISPEPFCISKHIDVEGNSTLELWFHDLTETFSIAVEMEAITYLKNPFNYLADTQASGLPLNYEYLKEYDLLKSYLGFNTNVLDPAYQTLKSYSDSIARQTNYNTGEFLIALSKELFSTIDYEERISGKPYPAIDTLTKQKGSCRDLAVLFNELCRFQGIASRFVSGYHLLKDGNREQVNNNNLHAWSEVYIPGGGWRGYDPTQGYATDDRYLTVAASCLPELAAPILGTFRGTEATSTFTYEVIVSEVS